MQESNKNLDINAVRRQVSKGGLRFEAYLPPRLAEWVIALVDQSDFHSPSEAVFVAMQSFRELDEHPDLKQELLKRTIQKGIDSAKEGEGIPAEKVMERFRQEIERPRPEPAVWNKSLDKPLFPEDGSGVRQPMTLDHTKPAAPKIHPLMQPEKVKEIWRAAQKRWTYDGEARVREIEEERDDWDRRVP